MGGLTALTRRGFFVAGAALAGATVLRPARGQTAAPQMNDDGLFEEPWFIQSFLDLREDLTLAAEAGKRFAVMWELKGCPYCGETHFVNFADPVIRSFVATHFVMVQLNFIGSRLVTDFDGEELSERDLARKWAVRFTPTTCFYPQPAKATAGLSGDKIEVARMPGYFQPRHFLAMFRFVQEEAYETTDFLSYLKTAVAG